MSDTAMPISDTPQTRKMESDVAVEALLQQYEDLKVSTEKLDEFFVFPEGDRPDIPHDKFDIDLPIIDLSPVLKLESLHKEIAASQQEGAAASYVERIREEINKCEAAKAVVEREIRAACEDTGFFQIVNHGFPMELLDKFLGSCRQIFDLPLEEKMKVREVQMGHLSKPGYTALKRSTPFTKHGKSHIWNEGFDMESPEIMTPGRLEEIANILWADPANHEKGLELRSSGTEYGKHSSRLSFTLLHLMSSSLGLPEGSVDDLVAHPGTQLHARLRVNHFPVCTQPELTWGIHGHTDPSVITVVYQDAVGGLQIRFQDGSWHGVRPVPGAFVVNVADFLQVWTNGRFVSAEHRVVANSKSRRFSIAYFVSVSSSDMPVTPRPELVDTEHPLRYRPFTKVDYFRALQQHGLGKDRSQLLERCFAP